MAKKMYIGHVMYPLFSSDFDETWNFSTDFSKNHTYIKFHETRPVGAELFHAGGRTDMTQLIVGFRNFDNASKNVVELVVQRIFTHREVENWQSENVLMYLLLLCQRG